MKYIKKTLTATLTLGRLTYPSPSTCGHKGDVTEYLSGECGLLFHRLPWLLRCDPGPVTKSVSAPDVHLTLLRMDSTPGKGVSNCSFSFVWICIQSLS